MSLDKMFDDVRQATGRLSDYETKTDTLLSRVATIQTRLAAMKQYRSVMDSLNQLAKRSPRYEIIGMIAEEQRRIKLLRTEQSELRTLVDEQQTAIQHIVSKLREQVATLSELRRRDLEAFQMLKLKHQQDTARCNEKLREIGAVMARASELHEIGDEDACIERIAALERDNARLRDILRLRCLPPSTIQCSDDDALTDADVAPAFALFDAHAQTDSMAASAAESGGEFDMNMPFFVDLLKQSPFKDDETENELGDDKEDKRDSGCDSDE